MTTYRLGDMVRIKAGAFQSFTGRIEGINQARRRLLVRVNIYGRAAGVKVGFAEVEKIEFARD
jgi:transcription termination/antitermination protein NusG